MNRILTLVIAMVVCSHLPAVAKSALSQAALQCIEAAGLIHTRGDGTTITPAPRTALPPCRAAQQEAIDAAPAVKFAVGRGLMTSSDVQEVEAGVALINRAADAGLPQAQYSMGVLYEKGFFKPKGRCIDFNECNKRDNLHRETAVKFYDLAAATYPPAASAMGYGYYYGANRLKRDLPKAFRHLTFAAEAGMPAAMLLLGTMYMNGNGAPQDKVRGLELVAVAAHMGHQQSQLQLGDYALAGIGMQANRDIAIAWYQKAKGNGSTIAADKLERLGVREWTTGQKLLAVTVAGVVLLTLVPDAPEGQAKAKGWLDRVPCKFPPWVWSGPTSCMHIETGDIMTRERE